MELDKVKLLHLHICNCGFAEARTVRRACDLGTLLLLLSRLKLDDPVQEQLHPFHSAVGV